MNPKEIVYIGVAALIAAVLLPISIGVFGNYTLTNSTAKWASSVRIVFIVVLPILIIIAVALKFLGSKKD